MLTKGMKVINNELYIGNYKASYLAQKFNTPLYVYDEENIIDRLTLFTNNFKSKKYETQVVYASKAFLCPRICYLINEYNMGIDSVSEGDLYQLDYIHFPFHKIVLHGNNKTYSELEYAIKKEVGYIVVDHLEELNKITEIAHQENKKVNLLLRVNPGISAHTHEYIQTSLLSSKFGESIFDHKKIDQIITICKQDPLLNFLGFHSHIGSSIQNPKYFKKATETMLEFILETSKRNQMVFPVLNLGGGFGIKYLDSDKEFNIAKMLKGITSTIDSFIAEKNLYLEKVLIEPGRSIVGDSGSTIYQVGSVKKTYGGKKYVFVDGGMTDNIRPALYQAKYTCDICNNMQSDEQEVVDVVGPCCESGDIIVSDYLLNKAFPNDYLITYCTGAYGYSMSSNYNGHVRGAVIFVNKEQINMGIRREEYTDLMKSFPVNNQKRIFDCHSDMLYDLWTNKCKGVENRFSTYHVPQLRNSVIKGSIFTMYSPNDFDLIAACQIALQEIDLTHMPDYKVILGLEGLRNLKTIADMEILYNMGFRHAMLTWNEENKWATGAKGNSEHGLTEEGKKLLLFMQEKGMIIDLAHTNEKTFYDILKVVNKNIIFSHGNCKALCNHIRNVTDDQMRALKKVDGLLGLTLANNFIDSDKEKQTMENFLKHVQHAIDIMGIDNVCFGFDFMDYLSDFPNSNLEAVKDATFSYRIIEGLESIGLNEEEIDKICYKNFYERFKDKVYN